MTPAEIDGRILLAAAVVMVAARVVGWLVAKLGQPRILGEILAGIVLGPSLLGSLWPAALDYLFPPSVVAGLRIVAHLGVVSFMFLVGLQLDLGHLRGQGHKAVVVSHASIVVPATLGALLGLWLHPRLGGDADRLGFTLFLGAAMAVTAFPVLARVLQETGLERTRLGVLTMTCAAVDDITAWCVLAGVVAVVESTGPADTLFTVGLSLLFVLVAVRIVRPLLNLLPRVPLWVGLTVAFLGAWVTDQIGIHAIFGAFMAGTVMPRGDGAHQIGERLEPVVLTLLLPIFFVVIGLATRVDTLDSAYLWAITGLTIAIAIAGKWGGSMVAARATGESWRDAAAIGILLNTRGLTELVILDVGLSLRVIDATVFTIMVLMALVTTFMAAPLLAIVHPAVRRGTDIVEDPAAAPRASAATCGRPERGGWS